ncbi:hypothetical protein Pmar_PMAR002298 [Perkinsus marinus ATCC 50983]|uniref:Lipoprotein n=1 Tax=Perkinsus marinus (strain ATCC 50983 / TXsc) TaxID=423536 RepID=C5KUY0_PERM5|nr:hypothetical protein Pmar_PMAR002298 [Perkinsus marinus ATCC 50983]EER11695.1 hypothetical protein Pmar_PMAR002298 [Perkinsus marinus ATCC 50983]|eukprot:XP_002779900.1 hypothetical protein Pmar_PMAR002298 [Perkinsus marinus ATCC 50983]
MKAPSLLPALSAALLFTLQGCGKNKSTTTSAPSGSQSNGPSASGLFLNKAGSHGSQSCYQAHMPYSLKVERVKSFDGSWNNAITADCGNSHKAIQKADADLPERVSEKLLHARMTCNDIWAAFGTESSASAMSLRSVCREALGVPV